MIWIQKTSVRWSGFLYQMARNQTVRKSYQLYLYNKVLYRMVVVYEKKNRSLVFNGSRKIPTLGSTVQWETRQASFPTGTVGPRVGIFLSPLNTNDEFYLSHTPVHVPAIWKDKKRRVARWPHVDPWRHCNVKMTSPCRISVYSGFSGSLFHVFFPNINEVLNGEQDKEPIIRVRME